MGNEKKDTGKLNVVKVTLGKHADARVAYLRELKISDTQLAAKAVGNTKQNQLGMQISMQNELLKLLLVQIDDKKLDHADKNNLDNIINVIEYRCLLKVIEKMMGEEESGEEPETEMVSL